MRSDVLGKIYANDLYLTYLRYHPQWYIILDGHPEAYSSFEKELKKLVKSHNENVDKCNNLKDEINELKYIKIWNKKCRINIEIRKVLFLEE